MSLTDEQVATIVGWVDQGAPEGNPADFTPKPVATGLYWQAERDGYGPPDLVITAPMQTMPARAPGRVVAPGQRDPDHRAALGEDGRDPAGQHPGPQDPAPLDRVSHPQPRERRRDQHVGTGRFSQRHAVGRRPRQPPAAADGVGHRQGLRPLHGRHRQADHAGREDLVGPAHPRRRRRDHERLGDRPVALSEGPGADQAQLPDRLHRPQERQRRPRHPAELDRLHRGLHRAAGEHAHHQLPAALPPARQGDAGRGDPARRPDRR